MKGRAFVIMVLLVLSLIPARFASGSSSIWLKTFGGEVEDIPTAIAIAPNGDIIVVGWTLSYSREEPTSTDGFVMRLRPDGGLVWFKTYGGDDWDRLWDVDVDPETGNIAVIGYTYSYPGISSDFWVMLLDPNGDVIWERVLPLYYTDYGFTIKFAPDGTILAGGRDGILQGRLVKLDEKTGDQVWVMAFPTVSVISDILPQQDGGAIVVGTVQDSPYWDTYIIRVNQTGQVKWFKKFSYYSTGYAAFMFKLIRCPDGGYIGLGYGAFDPTRRDDILLVKFNEDFNIVWQKLYGGIGDDIGYSLVSGDNGEVFVIGSTENLGAGNYDTWILKVNSTTGDVIWQIALGTPIVDGWYAVGSYRAPINLLQITDDYIVFSTYVNRSSTSVPGGKILVGRIPIEYSIGCSICTSTNVNPVTENILYLRGEGSNLYTWQYIYSPYNGTTPLSKMPPMGTLFSLALNSTSVAPAVVKAGDPVTVDATASVVETTVSAFNFSVSDGRSFLVDAVQVSPGVYNGTATITFTEPGDYAITAYAIDEYNNVVWKDTGTVKVVNVIPNFTVSSLVADVGEEVIFDASSTVFENTDAQEYEWDFGDGSTATGLLVKHSFEEPGNYTVTLTVRDVYGFEFSVSRKIIVKRLDVSFDWSTPVPLTGESVTFAPVVAFENTRISSVTWDFGDGSLVTLNSLEPVTHSFSESGNYTVKLVVRDVYGEEYVREKTIKVVRLVANFTVPEEVQRIREVRFDASSSIAENTRIVKYVWLIDGSVVGSGPVLVWEFIETRCYNVTLRVTDEYGHEASVSKTINVAHHPGDAYYSLARAWTVRYLGLSKEFEELYELARLARISNETLENAMKLHNTSRELMLMAWNAESFDDLWETIVGREWKYPKLVYILRAVKYEKDAITILHNTLGE